jgi:hypothetical protein
MIDVASTVTDILAGSAFQLSVTASSWLAGDLLADAVPIASATEEGDRSLRIPERVTFTVPQIDQGVDWSPGRDASHPLAANGQRLAVKIGVGTTAGIVESFSRGWFRIASSETAGGVVTVTAENLLSIVDEARLVTPFKPSGTLVSTLRGLLEPGLLVDVGDAPADRSVPANINYDEDRLGAVLELIDAWPADLTVNEDGFLVVTASVVPTVAVATLADSGSGAVVIRSSGSSSREGGFNAVVARGTAADGGQLQAVAYDTTSNRAIGSGWSPYVVPYFFPSPLLTTRAQCDAAAQTVLRRLQRQAGAEFTVEMVPNPTLQLGDAVQLETADFSGLCAIERLTLPYRIATGDHRQTLIVREVIAT